MISDWTRQHGRLTSRDVRALRRSYGVRAERRTLWTDEDDEIAQHLRGEGLSIRAIAEVMACSTKHVQKALRA